MLRIIAIAAWLAINFSANAQMLLTGLGHGSATGCTGAGCISFSVTGPPTGVVGVTSSAFTVTLSTGSFSGAQTITIADGVQGGTITPSVGAPGTSSVVVTPTAASTSFTFTYNPASTGTKTLTFTNAQGWTNASPAGYISTRTFTASGPSTGTAGAASTNFTVTIGNGSFNGTDTVTIADGGQGGTFTPSVGSPAASSVTVTPANAATSFTFTYNAAIGSPVTLTFTNAQGWINPVTLPYTGAITYTATGPASGAPGTPSTNFTVSMPASTHFTGSNTITVADGGDGGTFTPSVGSPGVATVTVTPVSNATNFTFTYNAASSGAKTLTFTNAQSWTNASPLTYTGTGGAGCAAATAWLARTSGLSGTETTAYTNLICGMITDGVGCSAWSGSTGNLDALYVFATNTTTTATLNLCSTSFTITPAGPPTFTADRGYTGNSSSMWLNSGFIPSTAAGNWTLNSVSFGLCNLNSRTTAASYENGVATTGATYTALYPNFTGNITYYPANDADFTSTYATANTQGSWITTRTASNAVALYLNGASVATNTTVSGAVSSNSVTFLALNQNGTFNGKSSDQIGYGFFGGGLNATQAGNIRTRLNTYLTAVGASGC